MLAPTHLSHHLLQLLSQGLKVHLLGGWTGQLLEAWQASSLGACSSPEQPGWPVTWVGGGEEACMQIGCLSPHLEWSASPIPSLRRAFFSLPSHLQLQAHLSFLPSHSQCLVRGLAYTQPLLKEGRNKS